MQERLLSLQAPLGCVFLLVVRNQKTGIPRPAELFKPHPSNEGLIFLE
jgi:hypothetical protein